MTTNTALRDKQQTIRHPVTLCGVGLHSGQMTTMRLLPAKPNHGVVFRRVDSNTPVDIPAHMAYVGCTRLCTTLENGGQKVATVEHFLSAVTGLGVDNLLVEIDGPEGSAPGRFTLKNATVIGATDDCDAEGVDGEMADFRKGATGDILNILFKDF